MKISKVKEMLSSDTATLIDLNDWAVNTVREYAHANDYNPVSILTEEGQRIVADRLNLDGYLKISRRGSYIRLNRKIRVAVYAVFATRIALADRW